MLPRAASTRSAAGAPGPDRQQIATGPDAVWLINPGRDRHQQADAIDPSSGASRPAAGRSGCSRTKSQESRSAASHAAIRPATQRRHHRQPYVSARGRRRSLNQPAKREEPRHRHHEQHRDRECQRQRHAAELGDADAGSRTRRSPSGRGRRHTGPGVEAAARG